MVLLLGWCVVLATEKGCMCYACIEQHVLRGRDNPAPLGPVMMSGRAGNVGQYSIGVLCRLASLKCACQTVCILSFNVLIVFNIGWLLSVCVSCRLLRIFICVVALCCRMIACCCLSLPCERLQGAPRACVCQFAGTFHRGRSPRVSCIFLVQVRQWDKQQTGIHLPVPVRCCCADGGVLQPWQCVVRVAWDVSFFVVRMYGR